MSLANLISDLRKITRDNIYVPSIRTQFSTAIRRWISVPAIGSDETNGRSNKLNDARSINLNSTLSISRNVPVVFRLAVSRNTFTKLSARS